MPSRFLLKPAIDCQLQAPSAAKCHGCHTCIFSPAPLHTRRITVGIVDRSPHLLNPFLLQTRALGAPACLCAPHQIIADIHLPFMPAASCPASLSPAQPPPSSLHSHVRFTPLLLYHQHCTLHPSLAGTLICVPAVSPCHASPTFLLAQPTLPAETLCHVFLPGNPSTSACSLPPAHVCFPSSLLKAFKCRLSYEHVNIAAQPKVSVGPGNTYARRAGVLNARSRHQPAA